MRGGRAEAAAQSSLRPSQLRKARSPARTRPVRGWLSAEAASNWDVRGPSQITSGAKYCGVPQKVDVIFPPTSFARPKSAIFTCPHSNPKRRCVSCTRRHADEGNKLGVWKAAEEKNRRANIGLVHRTWTSASLSKYIGDRMPSLLFEMCAYLRQRRPLVALDEQYVL